MSAVAKIQGSRPRLHPDFVVTMVRTFNDSDEHGVHPTARMTFLQPDSIVPVMDAITEGWRYGRSVKNLQFEKWEAMFEEEVVLVRQRYGVAPEEIGRALSPAVLEDRRARNRDPRG